MVFDPLDGLAPLLQAAAEDIARTGPPMGNLLAGTMGDGLVFAGHGGVPFAGDNGVQVTQDWQLRRTTPSLSMADRAVRTL